MLDEINLKNLKTLGNQCFHDCVSLNGDILEIIEIINGEAF